MDARKKKKGSAHFLFLIRIVLTQPTEENMQVVIVSMAFYVSFFSFSLVFTARAIYLPHQVPLLPSAFEF